MQNESTGKTVHIKQSWQKRPVRSKKELDFI